MKRKSVYSCFVLGLITAMLCVGCSPPSWVTEAEKEVPVIVSGVNAVLAAYVTLDSNAADVQQANSIASQITGDLTLASSLIQGFQSSSSASVLSQINAALSEAQGELPSVLTAVHVQDPTSQAKAQAIVSLLQSEISALEQEVPDATAAPTDVAMIGSSPAPLPPHFVEAKLLIKGAVTVRKPNFIKPLGAKKLKKRLNKILKQKTGSKNDAKFKKATVK